MQVNARFPHKCFPWGWRCGWGREWCLQLLSPCPPSGTYIMNGAHVDRASTWPLSWLAVLRIPHSIWIIESGPDLGGLSVLFVYSNSFVAFIRPTEWVSDGYRNGSEKKSGGVDKNLTWMVQERGLSATVVNRLLGKAEGIGNQIMIGLSGWPNSQLNLRCLPQFRRATPGHFLSWGKLPGWFWRTKIINDPPSPVPHRL